MWLIATKAHAMETTSSVHPLYLVASRPTAILHPIARPLHEILMQMNEIKPESKSKTNCVERKTNCFTENSTKT
jgi:hypothetical protein